MGNIASLVVLSVALYWKVKKVSLMRVGAALSPCRHKLLQQVVTAPDDPSHTSVLGSKFLPRGK